MKRNLLTLLAGAAIVFAGFTIAWGEADGDGHRGNWHRRGNMLEHMTETLNLTADQKAKVQPILDQAKPQIVAIRQEAMQKTKAVMDNVNSQMRPLLTPEQQQKLDKIQKARQDMRNAAKEMHEAKSK
jgi:Spy/CpxP family protein refolding chaperone